MFTLIYNVRFLNFKNFRTVINYYVSQVIITIISIIIIVIGIVIINTSWVNFAYTVKRRIVYFIKVILKNYYYKKIEVLL